MWHAAKRALTPTRIGSKARSRSLGSLVHGSTWGEVLNRTVLEPNVNGHASLRGAATKCESTEAGHQLDHLEGFVPTAVPVFDISSPRETLERSTNVTAAEQDWPSLHTSLEALKGFGSWVLQTGRELVQEGWVSEDGWTVFPSSDVTPSTTCRSIFQMPCEDVEQCKRICKARGCGGFVLEHGKATFHMCARRELLGPARRPMSRNNTRSCVRASVPTLLVAPPRSGVGENTNTQLEWIGAIEASLLMLRKVAEERRRTCAQAKARGNTAEAEAVQRDLCRVNAQQARLASALWQAQDAVAARCKAPMWSYEASAFQRSSAVVPVSAAVKCKTESPERKAPVSTPEVAAPSNSEVQRHGENYATAQPETSEKSKPETPHVEAPPPEHVSDLQNIRQSPRRSGLNIDDVRERVVTQVPPLAEAGGSATKPDEPSGKGHKRPPSGMGSKGMKGKGRQGPLLFTKGGNCGKGSAKGRKGSSVPVRMQSPIGRRFHWEGLDVERIRGTVFDMETKLDGVTIQESELNLEALQSLFADDGEIDEGPSQSWRRPSRPSIPDVSEVRVFSDARAQHIAIVLRRVFGLSPQAEDVQRFSNALLELKQPVTEGTIAQSFSADDLELLATALPNTEELSLLRAAPVTRLRHIEQLMLPLIHVPRAVERMQALRLVIQAEVLQKAPLVRMRKLAAVGQALKNSSTLKKLLRIIARLGSWINSADSEAMHGFSLSSGLGKLHQFRALRGDRGLSLLHVVALSAAGDNPAKVGQLGVQLSEELQLLPGTAREDLKELGQVVANFKTQANWLLAEAERPEPDGYTEEVQARLRELHLDEFAGRVIELEEAWAATRSELVLMLSFFAEQWEMQRNFETAVGNLLQTLEEFRNNFCNVAREIAEQPKRFTKVYVKEPVPASTQCGETRTNDTAMFSLESLSGEIAKASIKSADTHANNVFPGATTKFGGPHLHENFSVTPAEGPLGPIKACTGSNTRSALIGTESVSLGKIPNRQFTNRKLDTTFCDGKPLGIPTPARNVVRRGACRSRGPCPTVAGGGHNPLATCPDMLGMSGAMQTKMVTCALDTTMTP